MKRGPCYAAHAKEKGEQGGGQAEASVKCRRRKAEDAPARSLARRPRKPGSPSVQWRIVPKAAPSEERPDGTSDILVRGRMWGKIQNPCNAYYSSVERNKVLMLAVTWLDLANCMLSEGSQS